MSSPKNRGPTLHRPEPVVVYARWAGYAGRDETSTPMPARPHIYSSAIPPARPLKQGTRIRVLATSPSWYTKPDGDAETYEAYDAHVIGTITRVAGWKGRKIVLEVENECAVNPVKMVKIRIPFAPNVTVDMGLEYLPEGRREAYEDDLNTSSIIRSSPDDPSCGAGACCLPWHGLVGDNFLYEPMSEEVGDRTGADGGRPKMRVVLASWHELAETEARENRSLP